MLRTLPDSCWQCTQPSLATSSRPACQWPPRHPPTHHSCCRYAVPTWQDEQDIRSGKKVRLLNFLTRFLSFFLTSLLSTSEVGPPGCRLLLSQPAAMPAILLALRLPGCFGYALPWRGMHLVKPSASPAYRIYPPAHLTTLTWTTLLPLGTMWGIFDSEEASHILPPCCLTKPVPALSPCSWARCGEFSTRRRPATSFRRATAGHTTTRTPRVRWCLR